MAELQAKAPHRMLAELDACLVFRLVSLLPLPLPPSSSRLSLISTSPLFLAEGESGRYRSRSTLFGYTSPSPELSFLEGSHPPPFLIDFRRDPSSAAPLDRCSNFSQSAARVRRVQLRKLRWTRRTRYASSTILLGGVEKFFYSLVHLLFIYCSIFDSLCALQITLGIRDTRHVVTAHCSTRLPEEQEITITNTDVGGDFELAGESAAILDRLPQSDDNAAPPGALSLNPQRHPARGARFPSDHSQHVHLSRHRIPRT